MRTQNEKEEKIMGYKEYDEEIIVNDPFEMEKSRDASFLCELFQKHQLKVHEKQEIIRRIIAEKKLEKPV